MLKGGEEVSMCMDYEQNSVGTLEDIFFFRYLHDVITFSDVQGYFD